MMLGSACGGSSAGDPSKPSAHDGSGGSKSNMDAAVDASDGADSGSDVGHSPSGSGGHIDGNDGGGSDAGTSGHGGASGKAGASGHAGTGTHAHSVDAGNADAGGDSGTQDSGADSCASGVICNGACCVGGQVCKATQPFTLDVDWDFNVGATALHAVVGSTLRFNFDDTRHDVQLFPNEAAFNDCKSNTPICSAPAHRTHGPRATRRLLLRLLHRQLTRLALQR